MVPVGYWKYHSEHYVKYRGEQRQVYSYEYKKQNLFLFNLFIIFPNEQL